MRIQAGREQCSPFRLHSLCDWGRCTLKMLDLLLSVSELPSRPSRKPLPPAIPVLEDLGLGVMV